MTLQAEAKKLVNYINSVGLQIPTREPSRRHVGAIIADAVLQIGHGYENQVSARVARLRERYPEAVTVSALLHLLGTVGAKGLPDGWKGQKEHKRLHDHAEFFASKGIDTFDQLAVWLQNDKNRDSLITARLGIGNRTADYYRVLVRYPDAVKVDSRVQDFLADAGINIGRYTYEDLNTIVQLAARQLGNRPIDLDGAIWNYERKRTRKGRKSMSRGFTLRQAKHFSVGHGFQNEVAKIGAMPRPHTWKYHGFRHAKRGNYLLMWQWKNVIYPLSADLKSTWTQRQLECFDQYIQTTEGQTWKEQNTPSWLPARASPTHSTTPPPTPMVPQGITITLLPSQKAEVKKLADEWQIGESDAARVLILERLRQLN